MNIIRFKFCLKWKEELLCECPLGSFILEAVGTTINVYLPPEKSWGLIAPNWAIPFYAELEIQLVEWCSKNNATLHIENNAWVAKV